MELSTTLSIQDNDFKALVFAEYFNFENINFLSCEFDYDRD